MNSKQCGLVKRPLGSIVVTETVGPAAQLVKKRHCRLDQRIHSARLCFCKPSVKHEHCASPCESRCRCLGAHAMPQFPGRLGTRRGPLQHAPVFQMRRHRVRGSRVARWGRPIGVGGDNKRVHISYTLDRVNVLEHRVGLRRSTIKLHCRGALVIAYSSTASVEWCWWRQACTDVLQLGKTRVTVPFPQSGSAHSIPRPRGEKVVADMALPPPLPRLEPGEPHFRGQLVEG
mmetsp:Transcript_25523/g.66820  ORF Transcript_25523/g.66820 Transcript_25523/m.66820 type:complete len:231 (+) Transcript_25523:462-1154(+)